MTKTEEIMELVELFGNAMAKDELNQTSTQSATPYYKLKSAIEELVADTETIRAKWCERCAKVIEEELYPRPRSGYQIQYNAGIQELANKIRSLE